MSDPRTLPVLGEADDLPAARVRPGMSRRDAIRIMALVPIAGSLGCAMQDIGQAALRVDELSGLPLDPVFFDGHQWRTVRMLVDIIIPADERSGSATDALVPEFMDFMLSDASEARQTSFREGLAWLDAESNTRFGTTFVDATDEQRRALLDDIAYPARAREELQQGVTFFNTFRDMTAAGFFSSRMGYEDLQFIGNQMVMEWDGCPPEAMEKLGVSHDLMERKA